MSGEGFRAGFHQYLVAVTEWKSLRLIKAVVSSEIVYLLI